MTGAIKKAMLYYLIRWAGAGAVLLGCRMAAFGAGSLVTASSDQPGKSTSGEGDTSQNSHNIIFITTDQEKYFQQYPRDTDYEARERLKKAGVTFNRHYVASVMCTSSRAVLYTGQQVPNNKMFDNIELPWIKSLSPDIPTIGDKMREAGYYTAYIGKWHLTKEFEKTDPEKNYADAMEEYGFSSFNPIGDVIGNTLQGYCDDGLIAAAAVHWLRSKGEELRKKKQPWFLVVSFVNPHDIMYADADPPGVNLQDTGNLSIEVSRSPGNSVYRKKHDYPLPKSLFQPLDAKGRPAAHQEYFEAWNSLLGTITPDEASWKRFQDYYLNCIQDVDNHMLSVLDELEELGLTEDAIIVFTSDHGEMGGVHGQLRGKGPTAYEENIHVPFIIVHPDGPRGKECNAVTSHADIMPTMVGLSGVSLAKKSAITAEVPGRDLSKLLADPETAPAHAVREGALFADDQLMTVDAGFVKKAFKTLEDKDAREKLEKEGVKLDLMKRGNLRTVIDGRYKFTRYFAPRQHNTPQTWNDLLGLNDLELYDLEKDPEEMHNLAAEPEKYKDLIMEMNEKLNRLIREEIGEDIGQELSGLETRPYPLPPKGMD
ncbi:MAG: sulfatase-like hydrolase/transferase [PVC group bacterium]